MARSKFATPQERFMSYVEKTDTCWLWKGGTFKNRAPRKPSKANHVYGQFGYVEIGRRSIRAHIASYLLFVGPIAPGELVLHTCDVSLCVNPAHLYLGDHVQNMKDMKERNRSASGDRNSRRLYPEKYEHLNGETHKLAKLTNQQVAEIKAKLILGYSTLCLAKAYGANVGTIWFIGKERQWKTILPDKEVLAYAPAP